MFIHNLKYTIQSLLKNKTLIFWTYAFSIILSTFFYMAFSNIENDEKLQKIQERLNVLEKVNFIEDIEKISNIVNGMEKQNQAVLEIVKNMEDKYENITTFSQLQEKEIEKIINKKMKTMEAKYNKIIENKLKLIESNSKAKEKIQENKTEIKKKTTTAKKKTASTSKKKDTTTTNKIMYEIPIENNKNNIYSEVAVEEKIAAEPVYNQSLEEMLNKLRNAKLETSNLEKSLNSINQILGYTKKEDAEN